MTKYLGHYTETTLQEKIQPLQNNINDNIIGAMILNTLTGPLLKAFGPVGDALTNAFKEAAIEHDKQQIEFIKNQIKDAPEMLSLIEDAKNDQAVIKSLIDNGNRDPARLQAYMDREKAERDKLKELYGVSDPFASSTDTLIAQATPLARRMLADRAILSQHEPEPESSNAVPTQQKLTIQHQQNKVLKSARGSGTAMYRIDNSAFNADMNSILQENLKAGQDIMTPDKDKITATQETATKQTQVVADAQNQQLKSVQKSVAAQTQAVATGANQKAAIEKEHASLIEQINSKALASGLRSMADNFKTAAEKHREFGGAYKVTAEAMNLIDTYQSATAAYKSMASIPIVGPALGAIAAAAAVAAGIANAQKIASQKFALGTDYAPGGLAMVGEEGPEVVNLPRGSQVYTSTQTRNIMDQPTHQLTVHLHDASGSVTETFHRDLRSGGADRTVSLLMERMAAMQS